MKPATLRTVGYLISTASVALLGIAAWPGAAKAGLLPCLVLGMAASVGGMAFRWWSYRVEEKRERAGLDRKG
jgi:hypothetical protein